MIARECYRIRHRAYLRSSAWRELRHEAIARDGYRCVQCGSRYRLQVHHLRYRRAWQRDRVEWLRTLCADCHAAAHGIRDWRTQVSRDMLILLAAIGALILGLHVLT